MTSSDGRGAAFDGRGAAFDGRGAARRSEARPAKARDRGRKKAWDEAGEATVSIDELLRYEDDPRPRRRLRERNSIIVVLTQAAGLSAVAMLVAYPFQLNLPVLLVFPAALALVVLRQMLRQVDVVLVDRIMPTVPNTVPVSDALFNVATRWNLRLAWIKADPQRFARTVQPAIIDLANERLRQRHNCSLADDAARQLLGAPVWTFLTTPVSRCPTPPELAAIVTKLEEL